MNTGQMISKRKTTREKSQGKLPFVLGLLLFCLLSVALSSVAYGAESERVTLLVKQTFTAQGPSYPPSDVFTYRLVPKSSDAILSSGVTKNTLFTLKGTTEAPVSLIDAQTPGLYSYELSCVESPDARFVCDHEVYDITIYVRYDSTVQVVVWNSAGEKVSQVSFDQSYQGPPGGSETRVKTPGSSKAQGGLPKTGDATNPVLLLAALMLAGTVLCILWRRRRRAQTAQ